MIYQIEAMQLADWHEVQAIYGEGLATGLAAFASKPPDWEVWDRDHLPVCRLVARKRNAGILGFAALSSVSTT